MKIYDILLENILDGFEKDTFENVLLEAIALTDYKYIDEEWDIATESVALENVLVGNGIFKRIVNFIFRSLMPVARLKVKLDLKVIRKFDESEISSGSSMLYLGVEDYEEILGFFARTTKAFHDTQGMKKSLTELRSLLMGYHKNLNPLRMIIGKLNDIFTFLDHWEVEEFGNELYKETMWNSFSGRNLKIKLATLSGINLMTLANPPAMLAINLVCIPVVTLNFLIDYYLVDKAVQLPEVRGVVENILNDLCLLFNRMVGIDSNVVTKETVSKFNDNLNAFKRIALRSKPMFNASYEDKVNILKGMEFLRRDFETWNDCTRLLSKSFINRFNQNLSDSPTVPQETLQKLEYIAQCYIELMETFKVMEKVTPLIIKDMRVM